MTPNRVGPLKKASRGLAIPSRRIEQLNDMYWEQGMSRSQIKALGNSESVMDRALFQTRADWERFKREAQ